MKQRRALESTLTALGAFLVSASLLICLAATPALAQASGATPPPPPPPAQQLPNQQPPPPPSPQQGAPAGAQPSPGARPQMPPSPPEEENFPEMQMPTPQALSTPGPEAKTPANVDISGVAAIVNGQPVTNSALAREFLADGGQPTLNELIDRVLIDQAAKKSHVTVTPAEVDARLDQAKQQVMAQVWMRQPGITWAQFLTSQGRSEYYVRENIKTRLLLEKLVAKTLPPISLAGKMHLYHILILTIPMPGHTTPHSDADALAQIQKIRADIVSGKISFQDAARKYSEDTYTAQKGGDLGWVSPTDPYDPDFLKGAEALKEGEISQPIKSRYGYHLIYLARTGNHATPAEVKAITDAQQQARVSQDLQPYLDRLHATAKIQNLLLPGVPLPPPPKPVVISPPARRVVPVAPAK